MTILLTWVLFIASFIAMLYYSEKYREFKNKFPTKRQEANYYLSKGVIFTLLTIFLILLAMILTKVYWEEVRQWVLRLEKRLFLHL